MKKRRFREKDTSDNPLGIGLSKKTLILIGIGLAGVIAYKMYQAKKRAAPGPAFQPIAPPQGHDPIGLGVPAPAIDPSAMNGFGSNGHTPASTNAPPQQPFGSPSTGTAPASPPTGRHANGANYESAGGFSGLGDGGLGGGNSRM